MKLGKDLEAALRQHREYQKETEKAAIETTKQYNRSEDTRTKLEEEVRLLQEKFSLDLDDKTKRLQQELQVSFLYIAYKLIYYEIILEVYKLIPQSNSPLKRFHLQ